LSYRAASDIVHIKTCIYFCGLYGFHLPQKYVKHLPWRYSECLKTTEFFLFVAGDRVLHSSAWPQTHSLCASAS
jgi:hypothetical protein